VTGRATELPDVAPTLTARGLVLRRWDGSDAAEVLAMATDEQARRWSPSMRELRTVEDARGWIQGRLARRTEWAVCEADSGRLAGRVGLHDHDVEHRSAEIGYGVSPGFRRQGVALRAVHAASRYGFAPAPGGLALNRITLKHAVGNTVSCRVAMSCGFAFEGVARSALSRGDGEFDDVHWHARLAADAGSAVARVVPAEPVEVAAGRYQLCVADPSVDAVAVAAAFADPQIALWNTGPTDLEGARLWCAGRADWALGDHASWLVKGSTGGDLVGSVSVHAIEPRNGAAQIGYWVTPDARGRGVATAAVSAASRFAFSAVGLTRVELFHATANSASCRVADKTGFALEGVTRQSFRYGDGMLHDEHQHSRLASDA
jgi:RimJ/RimL family protein N-acetyltransferase